MTTSPAFWDRIAEKYAAKPIRDIGAYEEKLRRITAYLGPQMHVLEVGCGTGGTAVRLAPEVRHIHAIDYSQRMIDIANRKLGDSSLSNLVFEQANIDSLTLSAQLFDTVILMSLLHLVSDPKHTLMKLYDALKPGGVLVTSTPCLRDINGWLRWVAPIGSALRLIPRLACFSKGEHLAMIKAAGFEIEEVYQPDGKSAVFLIARKPVK